MTEFSVAYPEYAATDALDRLRATEYRHLDADGGVYLDYTGAGVAAESQFRAHYERLRRTSFGNPHSENPTSQASTELVESARRAVLSFFRADPAEYAAIFTANASAACRLVGEAYRFRGRRCVLTFDNHNSVNGIRQFARDRGGRVRYVPLTADLRVAERDLVAALRGRGLLCYPAQSNFTGVQHPLDWVDLAHRRGFDVLLDAAAYAPTNPLDLTAVRADFVPVSWYKVFGYPTGVGCLVARREALARLERPWFAGGTIQAVSVQGGWHLLADDESAFEDGTLNFLAVPDIEVGLRWIAGIGLETVRLRVRCLTGWLLGKLGGLRHGNGRPMVRIYGPADLEMRGGTVTFNVVDPDGVLVDERLVSAESAEAGFSLRTGCFCNPGAGEGAFSISRRTLRGRVGRRPRGIDEYLTLLGLPTGGAVRVSLGLVSTVEDVERLVGFVDRTYRDRQATVEGLAPRTRC
ncbi:aminotransferase class V-fold PLP-dependent enzyme [Fodinicola acaciae]|uniref:aminotransferase class V-fold PLP-dependent enzyme n=1 Tax=Fodinicola acaciae TaxID=2681555 RepID=UPI0013D4D527|nr:aminotransferase class V-fold PLP-dependent enzyme [Fodinicola acaciae]